MKQTQGGILGASALLAAGAILLTAVEAAAQSGTSQDAVRLDDIVVSASRTGLEPRQIGSAVTVITREDIDRQQGRTVKDLLQDVPGVQVSTVRPGDDTSVSIRGSSNGQVLVLLDGIKLGDPSTIGAGYQLDQLTTFDIERIEVLRGNQSSLYGSDAIGGVINIITRRGQAGEHRLNAEIEGGSYRTLNGGASILGGAGPMDYRVTVSGYTADGPSVADPVNGPASEWDAFRRQSVSGRVGYAVTEALRLSAAGFASTSLTELDAEGQDEDAFNSDRMDKDEYALALQAQHESFGGRWTNEITGRHHRTERTTFGRPNLPGGDTYIGEKQGLNYVSRFRVNDRVSLVGGGEYEWDSTEQKTAFSASRLDERMETRSVFGEMTVEPLENLFLTGAARIDDNSRFGSFDTYRATAAYIMPELLPGAEGKLRGSYGTGAKAPSLYQLFDPLYGNPDLEVEESRGWDVGFDLDWYEERLSLETTYFENRITNEFAYDSNNRTIQRGETFSRGVEIAAAAQPLDWLQIRQSYTYLMSIDRDTDLWTGKPRHSGTTSLTFLPSDQWSFTTRARYRSRNESSYGGATGGFVTVDLLSAYALTENVELYARIINLFDRDYQTKYGYSTYGLSGFAGIRLTTSLL